MDLTTIPFGEIVDELHRRGTFPSQIFKEDDLKTDRTFGPLFQRLEALAKSDAEKDIAIKKLQQEKLESQQALQTTTAQERFNKMVDGAALTPRQKEYVKGSYPKKLADTSDEALKAFLDAKVEDYKVAAKAFGVKEEALPAQRTGDKEPAEGDDVTKAKNNPLLEEDIPS